MIFSALGEKGKKMPDKRITFMDIDSIEFYENAMVIMWTCDLGFGNLIVHSPVTAPKGGKQGHSFRLSSESVLIPLAFSSSSAVFASLTRKTT